jgi:hypothetical protein
VANPAVPDMTEEELTAFGKFANGLGVETFTAYKLAAYLRHRERNEDEAVPKVDSDIGGVWVPIPQHLHPATAELIAKFAWRLAIKLRKAEQKYGYSDGWMNDDWLDECREKLVEHVAKGDPLDVAAYCAFLVHHGSHTALTPPPSQAEGEAVAVVEYVDRFSADRLLVEQALRAAADICRKEAIAQGILLAEKEPGAETAAKLCDAILSLIPNSKENSPAPSDAEPDAYCVTTPDGGCISTDPRCMHQVPSDEMKRLEEDARRYRWMKENVKRIPPGWELMGWDNAIDAAALSHKEEA